jgi:hypothetical protein
MSSGEALIKKVRTSTQKKFQSFIKCLNGKGHHFEFKLFCGISKNACHHFLKLLKLIQYQPNEKENQREIEMHLTLKNNITACLSVEYGLNLDDICLNTKRYM